MIFREHVPLAPYTTFHIGGPARYFRETKTDEEIVEAITFAHDHNMQVFILGGGSNLLIADEGYDGLVVHLKSDLVRWETQDDGTLVVVDAGMNWDKLVALCVLRGLWGLENLSGIPGSVGATPVQNIGAYGKEIGAQIEWVDVFETTTRTFKRLSKDDCEFGYRDSIFKHQDRSHLIVLRVAYLLRSVGEPDIKYKDITDYAANEKPIRSLHDVREAVLTIRSRKFPNYPEHPNIGTAGSFFKNPVLDSDSAKSFTARFPNAPTFPQKNGSTKLSAAWIIDHVLHMKGVREGDVGTWSAQALVMINYGNASASAVAKFAKGIIDRAYQETGVCLEPEVVYVGEFKS